MPYSPTDWVDGVTPLNAANMDKIEAGIAAAVESPASIASGEAPVWNGSNWARSSVTKVGATSLGTGTPDSTKVLRGDGAWSTIANAQIDAAAAIAYSKLNLASSIVNADVAAGAAIDYSKLNLASSIVNADIAAGAAIAKSKLASLGIVDADVSSISPSKLAGYPSDATKVLKGDGSWAVLSGGAAVATTIGGLGTASDGKLGLLRTGSSPYQYRAMVYDSTRAKWISEEEVIYVMSSTMGQTWTFDVGLEWTDLATAGLTPEFCLDWATDSSYQGGDYNIAAYVRLASAANSGGQSAYSTRLQSGPTYNAGDNSFRWMKGTWIAPTLPSSNTLLIVGLMIEGDSGGSNSNIKMRARMRWVG